MAHLIKLEDYISRYQFDIHRYPSQFTRLKKERWHNLKLEWELGENPLNAEVEHAIEKEELSKWKQAIQKLKSFRTTKQEFEIIEETPIEPPLRERVETIEELKAMFRNELFLSQLKWASTSLLEQSRMNPKYKYDELLRTLTLNIPDNYFLMYRPIFLIKQAPVDFDLVLIGPTTIYCIVVLEGRDNSLFEGSSERFWTEYRSGKEKKVLSPYLALNRMAGILVDILATEDVNFPIKKIVLAPNHIVDYSSANMPFEIVDRRVYAQWFEKIVRQPTPIKSTQIKVTKALLHYCHTTAYKRQEVIEDE